MSRILFGMWGALRFGFGLALMFTAGCRGYIHAPPGSSPPGTDGSVATPDGSIATPLDGPVAFTCDPAQKPAMDQLRALTTQQYLNALADLVVLSTGMSDAGTAVMNSTAVAAATALLPLNTPTIPLPLVDAAPASVANAVNLATSFPEGGWLRADQSIQPSRVDAYYAVGLAVAGALTAPAYLAKVVGMCALGSSAFANTTCLNTFIQNFGSRVLRRPVTAADVTFYASLYNLNGADTSSANPAAAAYQDVIAGLLNAPEFLYFVEHGGTAASNVTGVYPLSAYELASRLAFHVWDTLPDAELWSKAVDGSLLQPTVYQQQVDRLFADPRAQATLNRFLFDYFQAEGVGGAHATGGLNYHNLAAPNALASPPFRAFAGADLPTQTLFPDMVDDAVSMVDYYTWTTPGSLHDLLTSPLSFARSSDVAHLYGLPQWNGVSAPPAFPAGERPGLFTRALFMSAGIDTTPILKGIYLRRFVLCDTLGPPPPGAANTPVPMTTTETTRQAVASITDGSPCSGCHTSWINPLGFATENFDGLGRYRTQQTLYNSDGSVATKLPVDTVVTPYVMMADGTTVASGPSDLMNLIEGTNKMGACLSRNYFRYTFARFEDLNLDACSLEPMRRAVESGSSLMGLWKAVVQTPAFQQRTFQ